MTDTEILDKVLEKLNNFTGRTLSLSATAEWASYMEGVLDFVTTQRKDQQLAEIGQGLQRNNTQLTDEEWEVLLDKVGMTFVPRTDFDQLREELRAQQRRLTMLDDPTAR